MIHPLLRKLVTQPELFVEHASAYAELAGAEALQVGRSWRRKALLLLCGAAIACVALMLTGMAVLLAAALPMETMPMPWLLVGLPGLLWLVALLSAWAGRRSASAPPFVILREQWAADAQLARDAGTAS